MLDRINILVTKLFYRLGEKVGTHPKRFLIGSLIVCFICVLGFIRIDYGTDFNYHFTLTVGDSVEEKKLLEKYFTQNSTHKFSPGRLTKYGRSSKFILTAKDEETVFRTKLWPEINELHRIVEAFTIDWKGKQYNYSTLCAKWNDECHDNTVVTMGAWMDEIENGSVRITFPAIFDKNTYEFHAVPQFFGGNDILYDAPTEDDDDHLLSSKAVMLTYYLADDDDDQDKRGAKWEYELIAHILKLKDTWKEINVYANSVSTISDELEVNSWAVLPRMSISSTLLLFFMAGSSLSSNLVRSKPFVSFLGLLSANLGALSSFGIMCALGSPFIVMNMAVPFIALGIGVDDTFVVISAWWRTSPKLPVPTRMAQCYSEAAVSITITTLTDALSFYVGIITPIPAIQVFCLYSGTAVLCIYLFHLFFFGAVLALSGYREAESPYLKQPILCWKATSPPEIENSGTEEIEMGKNTSSNPDTIDDTPNPVMNFFRTTFSTFLLRPSVKVGVLVTYVIYLAVAVYGVTQLKEGLKIERMVRYDSYLTDFVNQQDKYFREFSYRFQIFITKPLDYSSKEVQDEIMGMITAIQKHEKITTEFDDNWLEDFLLYIKFYSELCNLNVTTEQGFIDVLINDYFKDLPDDIKTIEDIKFNKNNTKIIATRYIVQSVDVKDANEEKDLLLELRQFTKQYPNLEPNLYNSWFPIIDQYIIIRELTLRLVAIAAVVVMAVTIILIPSLITSIFVFFCIASIELGTVGGMALWGLSLDIITLLCLMVCVGFSVDFSAHVSYSYISSHFESSEDRIRDTMYSMAYPILQGSISTVLAVLPLFAVASYMYEVFSKIIIIIMVIAVFHGLILLPVLYSLFKPENATCGKAKKYDVDDEVVENGNDNVNSIQNGRVNAAYIS